QPGATAIVDGREYLYFVGTGYLGLQGRSELIAAATEAMARYGVASGTTRAGYGTTPPVREVERAAARFFGSEEALYFASGYLGPAMIVAALAGTFSRILIDEASHYSLWEAARGSGKPIEAFRHCDVTDLAARLGHGIGSPAGALVVSDGLFAAWGSIAPVAEYLELLGDYPTSSLLLDDCHGFGVLGATGKGTYELASVPYSAVNRTPDEAGGLGPRLYVTGTTSKALGSFGGLLPGSRAFIEQLKATTDYHAGASAPPIAAAAAAAAAFALVEAEPQLRERLVGNALSLRRALAALGLPLEESPSPVICLELDSAERMRQTQQHLQEQGMLVAYMPKYAGLGPAGALRIAVFATHTPAMLDQLADALGRTL
ncbi:MAG: pyridoxal phosphate-dependent aminotransferase family protein, partial [Pirellulales bacterium]